MPVDSKLLAKSEINGKLLAGCYLVNHSLDVMRAVESILSNIGEDIHRFFKLDGNQKNCLAATTRLAALWHDIGKANDGFQDAVTVKKSRQAIRHEHLSTLLMSLPEVEEWLRTAPSVDYEVARLIVLGHHLKAVGSTNINNIYEFGETLNRGYESFVVYCEHPDYKSDFKEFLGHIKAALTIPKDVTFSIPQRWSFGLRRETQSVRQLSKKIKSAFGRLENELDGDKSRLRLLMAAKAVLFAADAAASGLRRVDEVQEENWMPEKWIKDSLSRGCTPEDIDNIIDKRKAEVVRRKHAQGYTDFKFKEQPFQEKAAVIGERALLLTPCGSGKTLAAYIWIKEQLKTRSRYKAVFLYPTTGTATEGFKDYASHNPRAGLVHSRAEFDLEDMFENPDERNANQYSSDKKKRLFALGFWPDAIFSATADAFMSFVQNNYSSLCLLPVLARSVIVVDEVHSFDAAMFSELIKFLQAFDVPVLMMTASLPKSRRNELERSVKGLRIYPDENREEDSEIWSALKTSADAERYSINFVESVRPVPKDEPCLDEYLKIAREAYMDGRKVLWVVNTVDRCIAIAQKLKDLNALCYHSRYMYIHRVKRHKAVVEAFQPYTSDGVIAVTTQVCEMSLDLDADVLITELAPASSLIQRMGRCNRETKPRLLGRSGEIHIYDPADGGKPYKETIFLTGRELLLSPLLDLARPINQNQLAEAMKQITFDKDPTKACLFMMPMWESFSRNDYREIDDFAVSAVLESQLSNFKKRQNSRPRKSTAGLILQAPKGFVREHPGLWIGVVHDESESDDYEYCKDYGLRRVKR
ncbi:MAG: CRISPR-associated helicase Cas3' [Pyrinomonadaceae bacterium]